jgi:hypothetical protein
MADASNLISLCCAKFKKRMYNLLGKGLVSLDETLFP